jgi:hypothetical protein
MTSEEIFTPGYVTPDPIQMTPMEAFNILKAKFMTPALQAKSNLFDELGRNSTDDFIWLQKEDLDKIQKDVSEVKLKFKPLEVRYLLALINWIVGFNSALAWTALELQDFADWRRHSLTGTPI